MNIWCDNWCHNLYLALMYFHSYFMWSLLDLIFGMMLILNMRSLYKNIHDHWMLFCFNVVFLIWKSNCVHLCLLCFTLIIWWLCLMSWLWSFLGHVLVWLNVLHVKYWLLFWLFDLSLTLVFALVVCTYRLSFVFQVWAFGFDDWCDLIIWDAICFNHLLLFCCSYIGVMNSLEWLHLWLALFTYWKVLLLSVCLSEYHIDCLVFVQVH